MAEKESIDMLIDRVGHIACHKCGADVDVSHALPFATVKCPQCGADLPVPGILGQFILFREMGKGAMGAVYQGFDQTLKRHVAIKVMHRSLGEDPHFVDNFMREARALAALNHPNVVQIYTCGQEKGQPYIVMELIDGGRLDETIRSGKAIPETRLLQIATDVAKGLQAAKEIGLIHGDIKPENILFDKRGTAKVVDFGLARGVQQHGLSEVWGTPYYIAPEKARKQKEDHRADIYSLGATLFHAAAGRPPFDGESAREVVIARLEGPPPNLRAFRPDYHPETEELILRMLEPDPFKRYPTYTSLMADMNRALEAVRRGPAPPVSAPTTSHKKWIILGVLAAILIGGGLFAVLKKPAREKVVEPEVPTKMVFINGRWVKVRLKPSEQKSATNASLTQTSAAPAKLKPPPSRLSTAYGRGADATVGPNLAAGTAPELTVRSVGDAKLDLARKTYLRFDLSDQDRSLISAVTLRMTVAQRLDNDDLQSYRLNLWGLHDATNQPAWDEKALTWANAPANVTTNGARMGNGATLLGQLKIKPVLEQGKSLSFARARMIKPRALLDFIKQDSDGLVTLVLTANTNPGQVTGWTFASREHEVYDPPTLQIKTHKPAGGPAASRTRKP